MSMVNRLLRLRQIGAVMIFLTFLFMQDGPAVAEEAGVTTKIRTDEINYFIPGHRINVLADVSDDESIQLVRCYFRGAGEADFLFVPLAETPSALNNMFGVRRFVGQLPAPRPSTEAIDYLFLVVNGRQQVVKTQIFTIRQGDEEEPPSWQQLPDGQDLTVYTELDVAPEQLAGFGDNITIDIVESSARFGVVAGGLYSSSSTSAGGAVGVSGTAETTTGAGAVGTTTTSSGVITASTGFSTATIAAASAAGAVVVVGGVAAAGGSGGGGGGGDAGATPTATDCTQFDGNWAGPWSGVDCDGISESGSWVMTCTDCSCTATALEDTLSGTVNGNSIVLTGSGDCGTITAPGTFSGDQISGSYSYAAGGGGSFSGTRQ